MSVDELLLENANYLLLESGARCDHFLLESSTGIPNCGDAQAVSVSAFSAKPAEVNSRSAACHGCNLCSGKPSPVDSVKSSSEVISFGRASPVPISSSPANGSEPFFLAAIPVVVSSFSARANSWLSSSSLPSPVSSFAASLSVTNLLSANGSFLFSQMATSLHQSSGSCPSASLTSTPSCTSFASIISPSPVDVRSGQCSVSFCSAFSVKNSEVACSVAIASWLLSSSCKVAEVTCSTVNAAEPSLLSCQLAEVESVSLRSHYCLLSAGLPIGLVSSPASSHFALYLSLPAESLSSVPASIFSPAIHQCDSAFFVGFEACTVSLLLSGNDSSTAYDVVAAGTNSVSCLGAIPVSLDTPSASALFLSPNSSVANQIDSLSWSHWSTGCASTSPAQISQVGMNGDGLLFASQAASEVSSSGIALYESAVLSIESGQVAGISTSSVSPGLVGFVASEAEGASASLALVGAASVNLGILSSFDSSTVSCGVVSALPSLLSSFDFSSASISVVGIDSASLLDLRFSLLAQTSHGAIGGEVDGTGCGMILVGSIQYDGSFSDVFNPPAWLYFCGNFVTFSFFGCVRSYPLRGEFSVEGFFGRVERLSFHGGFESAIPFSGSFGSEVMSGCCDDNSQEMD